MLKAVIFDFGQTLADSANGFRTAEKEVQDDIFRDIGTCDRDDFLARYRRIRKSFHDRSDFSRKKMWKQLYSELGLEPDGDLLEKWEDRYWNTVEERTALFPETLAVLERLSSRYELAVITNTQGNPAASEHRLRRLPQIEKIISTVIVAGEDGLPPKPHPRPFGLCLERLGRRPGEAVFVGDDWRIDICGARNAGIRPIWLKHRLVVRNWPKVEETAPVITSLDPLLAIEYIVTLNS